MIEYFNRYSETDSSDKLGRWARLAVYKNIRIACITRKESKYGYIFISTCNFPTMQNDTANETKIFNSIEDAKCWISERWDYFLTAIS